MSLYAVNYKQIYIFVTLYKLYLNKKRKTPRTLSFIHCIFPDSIALLKRDIVTKIQPVNKEHSNFTFNNRLFKWCDFFKSVTVSMQNLFNDLTDFVP